MVAFVSGSTWTGLSIGCQRYGGETGVVVVGEGDAVVVGDAVEVTEAVLVAVGVAVAPGLGLCVTVTVSLKVAVCVSVALGIGVSVGRSCVSDDVNVGDAETFGVGMSVPTTGVWACVVRVPRERRKTTIKTVAKLARRRAAWNAVIGCAFCGSRLARQSQDVQEYLHYMT